MSNDIKELLNSVGAAAEECAVFFKSCKAQGFTDEQAMRLTCEIVKAIFTPQRGKPEEENPD